MFYIIYVFLGTAFALPKPTYSTTVNSASPLKVEVRALNVAKKTQLEDNATEQTS